MKTIDAAKTRSFKRSAHLDAASIGKAGDPEGRDVPVAFSSETPVVDFAGSVPMVLLHEPDAANFDRLRELGSVHFAHDITRIVGVPLDVKIEKDRVARAVVRFDDDEEGEHALRKVRSGSLRGVSVGFRARESDVVSLEAGEEWVSPGGKRFTGPLDVATKWEALELSLTSVPADAGVGVRRSTVMTKTKTDDGSPTVTIERDEGKLERKRVRALMGLARKYDIDDETLDSWCDGDTSYDDARRGVVDSWLSQNPRVAPSGVEYGTDGGERFERDIGAGLCKRFGYFREKDWPDAKPETGDLSPVRIARECLRSAGVRVEGMGPGDLVTRGLAHGTGQFTNILENSLTKGVAFVFEEESEVWRRFCAIGSTSKLNVANSRVSTSAMSSLQANPELATIQELTFSDRKEPITVSTDAGRFSLSRAALVNDDLSVFDRIPRMLGAAGAREIMVRAIAVLTDNANMSDGVALYGAHASGTTLGSSGVLSVTTLAESFELMRLQKSSPGESTVFLDIAPSVLLVPAAQELLASQILTDITPAQTSNVVPKNIQDLDLVATSHLDSDSGVKWYAFADPNRLPVLEVLFLDGVQAPQLRRTDHDDRVLGVSWVAFHDFGVGAVSWEGTVRGPGA